MGSCGAACQRRQYSELSDSRNVLKKQFENEIDQLKNETTKLQRKLKKQTSEIEELTKCQRKLQQTAETNKYNTEKEEIIQSQKHIILSLENKLDALQANTSNDHNDEEKLTQNPPEMDEINITDKRLKDTLRSASDVTDVKSFLIDQYKTTALSNSEFEDDDQDDNDESSVSSLASFENVAIEQAKFERDKQKEIDEEVVAMHQEMDQMNACQELEDHKLSDGEIRDLERSIDLDGDLPATDMKTNLFRNRSEKKWNMAQLSQQKKEMTAALAHLVETHVHSVTAAKEENNASSD